MPSVVTKLTIIFPLLSIDVVMISVTPGPAAAGEADVADIGGRHDKKESRDDKRGEGLKHPSNHHRGQQCSIHISLVQFLASIHAQDSSQKRGDSAQANRQQDVTHEASGPRGSRLNDGANSKPLTHRAFAVA
jgi:hypothetical protein